MYWTDWSKEAILRANKFTGQDVETIAHSHAVSQKSRKGLGVGIRVR